MGLYVQAYVLFYSKWVGFQMKPTAGFLDAVRWIEDLMIGPVAALVATVGIAVIGLLFLNGTVHWNRAAKALLGCFVIFGAPSISAGLLNPVGTIFSTSHIQNDTAEFLGPPPRPPEQYDPYAGAALPPNW